MEIKLIYRGQPDGTAAATAAQVRLYSFAWTKQKSVQSYDDREDNYQPRDVDESTGEKWGKCSLVKRHLRSMSRYTLTPITSATVIMCFSECT